MCVTDQWKYLLCWGKKEKHTAVQFIKPHLIFPLKILFYGGDGDSFQIVLDIYI